VGIHPLAETRRPREIGGMNRGESRWAGFRVLLLLFVLLAGARTVGAYSLLTHEQIVDVLWKDQIRPLLLGHFPKATEEDLRKAHAYAYGGCLIQDLGYYPFGSKFFSDLTHYVRSGDFVSALLEESTNLNEFAFALGALAHYSADIVGHPTINRVVAISFPQLREKYGNEITYAEDPKAHIRVEFGFDMTQVAKNRYTSDQYHDFIGFEVSKPLLERACLKTYNLKLDDVLGNVDLAIGTFRRAVSQVLPQMTRVALEARSPEIVQDTPNFDRRKFLFNLSRSEYEKQWGKDYRRHSFCARVTGFIVRWIPKVGPLKAMAFQIPTRETEDLYIKSVNATVDNYRQLLKELARGGFELPNVDFDTGHYPKPGEYVLSDATYAKLLDELAMRDFACLAPDLRADILKFYEHAQPPKKKKDRKYWHKTQTELAILKAQPLKANAQTAKVSRSEAPDSKHQAPLKPK
jgi:hypothetical protein